MDIFDEIYSKEENILNELEKKGIIPQAIIFNPYWDWFSYTVKNKKNYSSMFSTTKELDKLEDNKITSLFKNTGEEIWTESILASGIEIENMRYWKDWSIYCLSVNNQNSYDKVNSLLKDWVHVNITEDITNYRVLSDWTIIYHWIWVKTGDSFIYTWKDRLLLPWIDKLSKAKNSDDYCFISRIITFWEWVVSASIYKNWQPLLTASQINNEIADTRKHKIDISEILISQDWKDIYSVVTYWYDKYIFKNWNKFSTKGYGIKLYWFTSDGELIYDKDWVIWYWLLDQTDKTSPIKLNWPDLASNILFAIPNWSTKILESILTDKWEIDIFKQSVDNIEQACTDADWNNVYWFSNFNKINNIIYKNNEILIDLNDESLTKTEDWLENIPVWTNRIPKLKLFKKKNWIIFFEYDMICRESTENRKMSYEWKIFPNWNIVIPLKNGAYKIKNNLWKNFKEIKNNWEIVEIDWKKFKKKVIFK